MYEAQLEITCVDGMLYCIQGSDPKQIKTFLLDYDHEGSTIYLTVRHNPDQWETIRDPEQIYAEVNSWR